MPCDGEAETGVCHFYKPRDGKNCWHGTDSSLDLSETAQPHWHLDFGFLAFGTLRPFQLFRPPSLGHLVTAAPGDTYSLVLL